VQLGVSEIGLSALRCKHACRNTEIGRRSTQCSARCAALAASPRHHKHRPALYHPITWRGRIPSWGVHTPQCQGSRAALLRPLLRRASEEPPSGSKRCSNRQLNGLLR